MNPDDDRDDSPSFFALTDVAADVEDKAADPHDIIRRYRLSDDDDVLDMADWLEQRWTAGHWTRADKDLLFHTVERVGSAEDLRELWSTRPFRNAVAATITLALQQGRHALRLSDQHTLSWREPWGPVEQLIAMKVDYLLSAINVTQDLDPAMAMRVARGSLDKLRQQTPAHGEPGHITNAKIGELAYLASHRRHVRLVDHERTVRLYGLGPAGDPERSPAVSEWKHTWKLIDQVMGLVPDGTIPRRYKEPILDALMRSLTDGSARASRIPPGS